VLAAAARPGELGATRKQALPWMLSWLRERFDVVLVQGPDCADAGRLAGLAPLCDAVFVVLPQGETLAKDIPAVLARAGGRLHGMLHTHFE
jgi:Mrp family chromosome partitioning ATPase